MYVTFWKKKNLCNKQMCILPSFNKKETFFKTNNVTEKRMHWAMSGNQLLEHIVCTLFYALQIDTFCIQICIQLVKCKLTANELTFDRMQITIGIFSNLHHLRAQTKQIQDNCFYLSRNNRTGLDEHQHQTNNQNMACVCWVCATHIAQNA